MILNHILDEGMIFYQIWKFLVLGYEKIVKILV